MKDNNLNKNIENNPILDPHKMASSPNKLISEGESTSNLRQNKALSDLLAKLDQLPARTKVRIIFKDYHNYSNFLPYQQKYKDKFVLFKDKKDFIMSSNLVENKKENITLKESLIKFLEINKVPEEIKKILLEELQ